MNNFKKIGMTALAASLVSTSVFAGEVTVAGSASMTVEGYSSAGSINAGKGFSMGNQLTFTGGGELDNGMTVGISFVLDQGDDGTTTGTAHNGTSPFDGHSVSISSDAMGKLVMHGEGGSSAQAALDTTAAGDIWDTFDGTTTGVAVKSSTSGADILVYTLPSMVDGLSVSASYSPQQATATSQTAYGLTYTGIEGLSASYGKGEENLGSATLDTDTTTVKNINFYKHSETPGLGGEIQNPKWVSTWAGKQLPVDVLKGYTGNDVNKLDGLSGATLTSIGVDNTFKFWTGENGFGPFLAEVRKGALN